MAHREVKAKANWATRLILDPNRDFAWNIDGADDVTIYEMDDKTPVAQTHTTEPALLEALLMQIRASQNVE